MTRSARILVFAMLGSVAIACKESSPFAPEQAMLVPSASRRECSSASMTPVFEFANQGTAEGVAVSQQGDVFVGNAVSGNGEIWRAPKGDFGRASRLARLRGGDLIGMDVDRFGNVYAAVVDFADPDLHGLWKVRPDGRAERVGALAGFASLPNDVAVDRRGNVYVSDSFEGTIWRLTPSGELSPWIRDDLLRAFFGDIEFGVNGIVVHHWAVYAVVTLTGRVIRIPIQPDGAAGRPVLLVQDDALIGMDGIEPDERGNLYVTNNFASSVQEIRADDLGIQTIADEGLSAPASLAFNRNHTALYVANLSTSASFPQPYAPALVAMTFGCGQGAKG